MALNLLGNTGTGGLLGNLGTTISGLVDPILPGGQTGTGAVDTVVNTISGLLGGTGSTDGGLLGNLFGDGLLGGVTDGTVSGIGLLGDDGVVTLDLLGTTIAVLPENGGIVTVDASGVPSTGGGLLDLGGILGNGGLLNLTNLLGDGGIINITSVLGDVINMLGDDTLDPDDFTDEDGNIDPSKFDNAFVGTSGRDHFSLSEDVSTYVNGKDDIDTVSFGRSAEGLTVTVGATAVMFSDKDSLFYFQDVERVQFFEGTLLLDTGAGENAGVAYRLYQAAFDRTPDNNGVKFWVDEIDNGLSAKNAAAGFVSSAEFQQTYGNLSNAAFVDQIYENVLGRAAEAAGTAFWNDYLASGRDRADVLLGFSESTENVALVGASIEHGYSVA